MAKRSGMRRLAAAICGVMLMAAGISCGDDPKPPAAVESVPESFVFFDVGANTQLTDGLRSALQEKLGRDSISGRNVLNLEIHYAGFLAEHFPDLEQLNRGLNGNAGFRVEHDTVTLTYRHMRNPNTPFDFVEMVFDDRTRRPLVIRIRSGREDADILETLTRRYQEPQRTIIWGDGQSKAYYWEKNKDVLVMSVTPNPVGRPVHRIDMYYVNSIISLIRREREDLIREQQKEESAVKDAFSGIAPLPGVPKAFGRGMYAAAFRQDAGR